MEVLIYGDVDHPTIRERLVSVCVVFDLGRDPFLTQNRITKLIEQAMDAEAERLRTLVQQYTCDRDNRVT